RGVAAVPYTSLLRSMLTGRRLFVDQKNATMQLSSPATEGAGAGRITAKFRSNTSSGRRQTATAANSNAWQFQTDPNAPVAIEARSEEHTSELQSREN